MSIRGRGDRTQRALDVVLAVVGLVVTAPLSAILALAVKGSSPGPILHRARRVGRGGVEFTLYKFRSMQAGAAVAGPGITVGGDRRVTKVGRLLRSTKLDELPQLFNVVRGEMSIVGPRPEDPRYVAQYTDDQREILRWRPGITSPASVRYRDEEKVLASMGGDPERAYLRIMAEKVEIDLEYMRRRSMSGDLRLMCETLAAIVRR